MGGYEWHLYLIWFIFGVLKFYILFLQSFQSKLSFSSKEIVALSCSWCKTAYHNKESCFNLQKIGEECNLGKSGISLQPVDVPEDDLNLQARVPTCTYRE
jgi:hypothetical protein